MASIIKRILYSNNNRTNAVKKNIVGSILVKGISILIQLLLVPLTLGYLSTELYGIWLTLSSILIWINFFDVGFTLGLKNKLAEAIAIGDLKRGKALVSTTYFMMIIIFVPLCIILEVILPHINWSTFLNVNQIYNEQLVEVMQVLVICFCLQMIFNVISSILAACQKVALSSAFPVIGNFLALIAIYLLTKFSQPSLLNLALAISYLPIIVYFISSIIFFSGKLKAIRPSFNAIDTSLIKDILNLGVRFFIIQIQLIILYQSTNILISNISSAHEVTIYNIAYKYMSISIMVLNIILSPMWPAFTDAYAKSDYTWMNTTYKAIIRLFGIQLIAIIIMAIFSPLVYEIWIGDKVQIPILLTSIIAVYIIINSFSTLNTILLNGIGCVYIQTLVSLIGTTMHIPISLILGRYIGVYGVITSMIFITSIYAIVLSLQLRKILSKSAKGIWLK